MRRLAAVVLLSLVSAVPSYAASLSFVPRGDQLDVDAILDIQTSPGALIEFTVRVNTTELAPFERLIELSYIVDYDGGELATAGAAFDIERRLGLGNTTPDLSRPGAVVQHIARPDQPLGLPPGQIIGLDILRFTALPPLNNDGLTDFSVMVARAMVLELGSGEVREVTNVFLESPVQRVEVQPVPEPSTFILLSAGLVRLLVGRRLDHGSLSRLGIAATQIFHSPLDRL